MAEVEGIHAVSLTGESWLLLAVRVLPFQRGGQAVEGSSLPV